MVLNDAVVMWRAWLVAGTRARRRIAILCAISTGLSLPVSFLRTSESMHYIDVNTIPVPLTVIGAVTLYYIVRASSGAIEWNALFQSSWQLRLIIYTGTFITNVWSTGFIAYKAWYVSDILRAERRS